MAEITQVLDLLLQNWLRELKSVAAGKSMAEIKKKQRELGVILPLEFHEYFSKVNGMAPLYLNDKDEEGFTFYPLEEIICFEDRFAKYPLDKLNPELVNKRCVIFATYMDESWWYGCLLDPGSDSYSIILIESHFSHEPYNFLLSF